MGAVGMMTRRAELHPSMAKGNTMTRLVSLLTLTLGLGGFGDRLVEAADNPEEALQGVWVAQSMEADGKAAPADVVKQMRFTFRQDKLLIRGNFSDDREEECSYKLDPARSPRHLDILPPREEKPVLAIYELQGDQLKVCLRHNGAAAGRPRDFQSLPNSQVVLIVFKRQQP